MLSFRVKNQTGKNVADTTFKGNFSRKKGFAVTSDKLSSRFGPNLEFANYAQVYKKVPISTSFISISSLECSPLKTAR